VIHPTAHSPRRGDPGGVARRPQSGAPTVRLVHGGVQYREYLKEEQRSQRGCIAGRMQLEFHHGLLSVPGEFARLSARQLRSARRRQG